MHVICLEATGTPTLPGRVCGILARQDIDVTSMSVTRRVSGDRCWQIQITGQFANDPQLERTRKQLSRLVDVVRVHVLA